MIKKYEEDSLTDLGFLIVPQHKAIPMRFIVSHHLSISWAGGYYHYSLVVMKIICAGRAFAQAIRFLMLMATITCISGIELIPQTIYSCSMLG
jgi:ABC-type uncharacterized transport system fused permease/ATPase subunit